MAVYRPSPRSVPAGPSDTAQGVIHGNDVMRTFRPDPLVYDRHETRRPVSHLQHGWQTKGSELCQSAHSIAPLASGISSDVRHIYGWVAGGLLALGLNGLFNLIP